MMPWSMQKRSMTLVPRTCVFICIFQSGEAGEAHPKRNMTLQIALLCLWSMQKRMEQSVTRTCNFFEYVICSSTDMLIIAIFYGVARTSETHIRIEREILILKIHIRNVQLHYKAPFRPIVTFVTDSYVCYVFVPEFS